MGFLSPPLSRHWPHFKRHQFWCCSVTARPRRPARRTVLKALVSAPSLGAPLGDRFMLRFQLWPRDMSLRLCPTPRRTVPVPRRSLLALVRVYAVHDDLDLLVVMSTQLIDSPSARAAAIIAAFSTSQLCEASLSVELPRWRS